MSWMDSWSRPSKHAATPPPFYLLPAGEATPYCHTCGRVIGSRKVQTSKSTNKNVKYCSERCRHQKPDKLDRIIEATFVSLLNEEHPAIYSPDGLPDVALPPKEGKASTFVKRAKGESRITVFCSTVEELVFGSRQDPEKVFGRKKNRAKRGMPETGDWKSVDMEDGAIQTYEDYSNSQADSENQGNGIAHHDEHEHPFPFGTGRARPAQNTSDVNFSVGGERGWTEKIEETEELKQKRLEGQRRAEEREAVRCAARRLCAFGIVISGVDGQSNKANMIERRKSKKADLENFARGASEDVETRKKCEAILKEGTAVEASFAKGEWGIRWRE